MPAILWSIDTLDWKTRNAQNTINVVLSRVKDGDIILMHDLYSTSADAAEDVYKRQIGRESELPTRSGSFWRTIISPPSRERAASR